MIQGDVGLLEQVLINLITNAVEALKHSNQQELYIQAV